MDYSDEETIDAESGEDIYYSDDDREIHYGFAEEVIMKPSQKSYTVLKEEDIRKHQRDDIERVSTVLSLSPVEAIVLLLHYHWNVSKVEDKWFTDEERIRKTVGIPKEPVVDVNGGEENIECGICFEPYTREEIATVACGHPYCITCWTSYITTQINDGPGCLRVKCPEPSCSAAVGQDMIDKVSNDVDKEKYYRYFLRSYVEEDGKKMKWCPGAGCEYAVDFSVGSGSGSVSGSSCYDVYCLCSNSFCWNCSDDAHSPVDCDTVSKWILKNKDESENQNWILTRTKPCPKCNRPIEKNQGCSHMSCSSPCYHQFCWVCLEPWTTHRACNKFVDDEAENKIKSAKKAIDKYMHYYVRWGTNQSSRLKAMKDLEKLQQVHLKLLCDKQCKPEIELQFTVKAWLQIIECRRVLKWTYAYGYYIPNHETAKREFFGYLQGEAESVLEKLHHCAEKELVEFILKSEDKPIFEFDSFRTKLTDLTRVTKTYFENLIIECRRVLKWTYAYGYYLPDHEKDKRKIFKYLQGEAESVLERLHQCAEKELVEFILKSFDSQTFSEFDALRMKLTGLTTVTKTYFENLVKALENGLADLAYNEATATSTTTTEYTKKRMMPTGVSSLYKRKHT